MIYIIRALPLHRDSRVSRYKLILSQKNDENDIHIDTEYIIYGLRWLYPIFIFLLGIFYFNRNILDKKFDIAMITIFFNSFVYTVVSIFFWDILVWISW